MEPAMTYETKVYNDVKWIHPAASAEAIAAPPESETNNLPKTAEKPKEQLEEHRPEIEESEMRPPKISWGLVAKIILGLYVAACTTGLFILRILK